MGKIRLSLFMVLFSVLVTAGCSLSSPGAGNEAATPPAYQASDSAEASDVNLEYITAGCRTPQTMADWARANPKPSTGEGSWSGMCGSLMYRAGNLQTSRSTAYLAGCASGTLNRNYSAAPAGAFHFWSDGGAGHVGCDLTGGGYNVLMASSFLRESWGSCIGITSISAYNSATGKYYMGWANNYCGSQLNNYGTPWNGGGGGGVSIPKTSTEEDGIPGTYFWMRMQYWAKLYGGYTGPLDGVMGVNSWKGVQVNLTREYGYTGPCDGLPGVNTYKAMQRWAARYGYTGPIDGALGPNSYRAIAKALNTL